MRIWNIFIILIFSICPAYATLKASDPLFRNNALVDFFIISAGQPAIMEQANRLAELKREKGLKTKVISLDSIQSFAVGKDLQEKIRNTIKIAHQEWGCLWVLLFGDYKILPPRLVQTWDDTLKIESDIYYSCLDGDWDPNANGVYGDEIDPASIYRMQCRFNSHGDYVCDSVVLVSEGLDLAPDVCIGRLPAANGTEAKVLVDKIISYSYRPHANAYGNEIQFLAHEIFSSINGTDDGTYYMEKVKDVYDRGGSACRNMDISRTYEDKILSSGEIVQDSLIRTVQDYTTLLNHGSNMVFWIGHGSPRDIEISSRIPKNYIRISDAMALQSNSYSNFITISCQVMLTVDDSCIAKTFLLNPNGGAVSFSGASESEYPSLRTNHFAKAARMMSFEGVFRIAKAFQLGNAEENAESYYSASGRKNFYVHQYWGDPEMETWTKTILPADSFEIAVEKIGSQYRVHVFPEVDSALICLYKPLLLFQRAYTQSGVAWLDTVASGISDISVTATCHNFLPTKKIIDAGNVGILPGTYARNENVRVRVTAYSSLRSIVFNISRSDTPVSLTVYDLSGRIVKTFHEIKSSQFIWKNPSLANGIYLIGSRIGVSVHYQKILFSDPVGR